MLWEGNEIAYNHGAEHKMSITTNVTWRRNYVHHNQDGIWYDGDNVGSLIEENVIEDNAREGIFYEISGQGIIRNNTVRRSGYSGIFVSTSRDVEIYGNVLENNARGINFFLNCDVVGFLYPGSIGFDLRNNNAHDNTIVVSTPPPSGGLSDVFASSMSQTGCTAEELAPYVDGSKNLVFQSNSYDVPDVAGRYWVWGGQLRTFADWQAVGQDTTASVH
jgi:parallel beta-helix repeat protein